MILRALSDRLRAFKHSKNRVLSLEDMSDIPLLEALCQKGKYPHCPRCHKKRALTVGYLRCKSCSYHQWISQPGYSFDIERYGFNCSLDTQQTNIYARDPKNNWNMQRLITLDYVLPPTFNDLDFIEKCLLLT